MARRKKQNEEDLPKENTENTDDTFGLPEIEYEPLKRDEPVQVEKTEQPVSYSEPVKPKQSYIPMEEETQNNEYNTSSYYNEEEESSPWPKIFGITAVLLLIGGAAWFFGYYQPKRKAAEKEKQEQIARDEAAKQEQERLDQQAADLEKRKADSLASITAPVEGEIATLSDRTGRYYVIVASGIDGDLIMDYAKKLAPKGLNPKIIPPHGKVKFYRLAIAEGDTYAATQATADELKSEYTAGTWVVKW
jgi:hypothetical protein